MPPVKSNDQEFELATPGVSSRHGKQPTGTKTIENESIWRSVLTFGSIRRKVQEETVGINQRWSILKDRANTFFQTKVRRINCTTNEVTELKSSPVQPPRSEQPQEDNSGGSNPDLKELLPSLMAM